MGTMRVFAMSEKGSPELQRSLCQSTKEIIDQNHSPLDWTTSKFVARRKTSRHSADSIGYECGQCPSLEALLELIAAHPWEKVRLKVGQENGTEMLQKVLSWVPGSAGLE